MNDRLFPLEEIPEVPLFREPPPGRGALIMDERINHDYPPEWHRCPFCEGTGKVKEWLSGEFTRTCSDCLGMGSVKAMVRLLADHRCERCHHPYIPKGDAKMLGVEPTPYHWSPCDAGCSHRGPIRVGDIGLVEDSPPMLWLRDGLTVEAEWRILTVHHLDGDKANLAWWNLAALCQRCHLEIQAKIVLERVYPHEHSGWFKPHAAGWYAHAYLGEDLARHEVEARLDELLALERVA